MRVLTVSFSSQKLQSSTHVDNSQTESGDVHSIKHDVKVGVKSKTFFFKFQEAKNLRKLNKSQKKNVKENSARN